MPQPPGEATRAANDCDLYTLLTEFIALRQEIRLQNREQHSALRAQQTATNSLEQAAGLFTEISGRLENMQALLQVKVEKQILLPFLDVRDPLVRGLAAAHQARVRRRFGRKPPKELAGVAEGYEMALRRFDRALAQVDIVPVETVGQPFDPNVMRAVSRAQVAGIAGGRVISEQAGGFVRGREVIRTAEVVVNQ